ncbi:hypothetical protein ATCC90586_002605 [Pythium insidiosum]|nr:hypothetical protein ATCC90586_002605 [Pythium insidiosum]
MSTFDDVEFLVQWIRDRITLPGYQPKAWSSMDLTTVKEFVESTNIPALFITLLNGTLSVTTSAPRGVNGTVMYFVKNGQVIISPSNVADALQFGTVGKDSIASLLHLMNGHFLQRLQANKAWPESIQKEFTGQFFRFMSSLTETVSRGCGKTVLYLPPVSPDKFNYKDKDLVQQLESTVIHWTRQIKEVINNQDNAHDAEGAGPLEEIKFWEHRTQDLSGITDQLNRQGVKEIVEILRQAKSSYLQPFETLSQIIKQGSVEANDNLKFLKKLSPVCEDIARAQPDEISLMLPKLLNFIRLIWTYSKHYNTEDRITSLLRKVSNEIIVVCCKKISLHDIFDGNVEASICHLEQSIQCGIAWKQIYHRAVQAGDHNVLQNTEKTLIHRVKKGFLTCNFDRPLLNLFAEVHYWQYFNAEKKDGEEVDGTDDVSKSVAAATSTAVAVNNFYQSIFNDEEILKVLVHIMNGMSSSATELQKYLGYWDKYKLLWNQDKQAFIRRYAKANRPLQQFRADIERYREQQTSIQNEDLTNTINFIQIDTNFLKASLVEHTVQWIGKLTGLLNQTAHDELRELMTMMKDNTRRLQVKPTNLDHLGESIRLLQDIKEGIPGVIARFEPLQQKYDLLSEFDVQVTDEEQRDLANLKTNWDTYEVMLGEANTMLQKCKISMKQNLQDSVAELNTIMSDLRAEAEATLPYSGDQVSGVAHKILADFEKKMESTRARQSALKKGLEIFGIEESKNEGFLQTEKEIELLQQIWVLTDEWESVWATWKNKVFYEIEVDSMEATAAQFFKKVVNTLSGNASKELSIEQALDGIEKRWAEIEIDIGEYKGVYYKIKSADDLFTALEDDQVQLSTMKASPFFGSFDTKILYWERALSLMSEVIETLLTVQRSWIYLESIFMASEDIRKQLPLESTLFDEVNSAYCRVTEGMAKTRNALKATQEEGVLPTLQQMEEKLDRIQKCLDQYLETKRMLFPRFYFLSNDDLLEILGHQKDPDQVQKHIKKCFEAIKTLVLIAPGTREGWLLKVESAMVNTLEKIFAQCLVGYKGKKEKWIKDFPGHDGLDYKSVGRMFSGLVQSGGWGCFDEFNRIEIEVLSVVAQQVLTIMQALATKQTQLLFLGTLIKCNHNMGIFITMNPGYAGRTELPDNLKALMRPCAMMVPDLALIAEVMLQAEGFRDAKTLAKKTTTLYGLMIQQLSKQDHYDFGLRSLKAVLNMAGALKREDPNLQEENILLRALRDMNMPKFIREDAALFRLLLGDLFPGIELPVTDYGKLQGTIEQELADQKLQVHGQIVFKTIQLYESQVTRHCNMIVGQTMAGKSTIWKTLQAAKTTLAKDGIQGYMPVRVQVLNPKSISLNEIYGVYDLTTFEWIDGILSAIFRNLAADERAEEKWIMLDGPVDTLWIESMNSVMDDNKVLTLINGDRISMSPSMSLLFEVQDLAVASPATVSRAGMVYMDVSDLGYRPFVQTWLATTISDSEERDILSALFEKYMEKAIRYKTNEVSELIPVTTFNSVKSFCNLYNALATKDNGVDKNALSGEGNKFAQFVEKWFLFCMTWSVMGAANEDGRKKFDMCLRDIDTVYPPLKTAYDFYVDAQAHEFKLWDEKLPQSLYQNVMEQFLPTPANSHYLFNLRDMAKVVQGLLLGDKNVVTIVAPKKEVLKKSQQALAIKQKDLQIAKEKLQEVTEKVENLKRQYDESVSEKNALREEAELLELKLSRAEQLVKGLAGERERWQVSIAEKNESLINVVGDALVAAAFISYAGPFDSFYRASLVDTWMNRVIQQGLPISPKFTFTDFLADPTDGQANKWIKSMEGSRLEVVDPMMKDLLRKLENGIRFGFPVLMQDVLEELDPSLEPVLNKSIIKIGNREVIRLGDKELDYNRDFKFYLTTKLHNPHYTPEVSTKTTIVNFVVKEQGLEAQLLGITVQLEEPALEEQKSDLVVRVAAAKKKLIDLENEILRLLSAAKGSLLDDESLVTTLNASKTTSEEVTQQLIISEETEKKIDAARMGYARVALRSSTLYFVLNDMTSVDPMYQFSLDSYVSLFKDSIVKSRNMKNQAALSEELTERINAINDYHTYAVYAYACRGLFERHKLLFSLQMCVRVLQSVNKLPQDEYEFLLKGGNSMGSEERVTNAASEFLSETAWLSIVELNKLQRFHGLISSFEQSTKAWKSWYQSSTPEIEPLPGDWDGKCNELQRMLLLRCIRPDRLSIQAARFTTSNLGAQFVDPPPFDLKAIYETSNYKTPLIFVLSPGVDPTNSLMALADSLHKKVENCALGQGQATVAEAMLQRGLEGGNWVFLANCHLMLSWAPTLEKLIDSYCSATAQVNPGFRLWLTSDPNPKFPIAILQRGIKMTTEPPRGLKANLLRLYNTITPEKFARCRQVKKYKRLLFCLCWFHSLLLERRKFNNLGWNIPYDFNESDFAISEDVLAIYLDEYEETPWDALKYLIAQANYGGRVTDDWDRRLMLVYINQFFSEEVLQVDNMPLSDSEYYFVPDDGDLHAYAEYIKQLPLDDPPAAFGQHPNAQIASQIDDGRELLSTILSLQAMGVAEGGKGNDEKVLTLLQSLKDSVPEVFDLANIKLGLSARSDPDALKTVLMQELERYNKLLSAIRARKNGISIDSLNWEFLVINQSENALTSGPKDGAYVKGLILEGARWDFDHDCLTEPFPMELHSSMPILHFKPVESKKKSSKGLYSCPLYLYPLRTGTRERPSFMIAVDLKSGSGKSPDLWTKRGTALLLSLST